MGTNACTSVWSLFALTPSHPTVCCDLFYRPPHRPGGWQEYKRKRSGEVPAFSKITENLLGERPGLLPDATVLEAFGVWQM